MLFPLFYSSLIISVVFQPIISSCIENCGAITWGAAETIAFFKKNIRRSAKIEGLYRIEITSPGGLLPNVSIEDLGTGVSEFRNKVIGKILNESGLIEGYGTGVLRIRKYIREKGLIEPEFRENNGFFKAIFFNSKVGEEKKEGEVEREVEKLTENQKMILDLIKNDPYISKIEMSNAIGIRVSSIDKNITTLKEKGYLRRVGHAKGGHWELLKNIG